MIGSMRSVGAPMMSGDKYPAPTVRTRISYAFPSVTASCAAIDLVLANAAGCEGFIADECERRPTRPLLLTWPSLCSGPRSRTPAVRQTRRRSLSNHTACRACADAHAVLSGGQSGARSDQPDYGQVSSESTVFVRSSEACSVQRYLGHKPSSVRLRGAGVARR